ncbi:MAG: hypothetical protein ABW252_12270 [Polyangiales bacterium]
MGRVVVLTVLVALAAGSWAHSARAEFLHAPVGGKPVLLGDGRVTCETSGNAWSYEQHSKLVRPPAQDGTVGKPVELKVAESAAACADESTTALVTLLAVDRFPTIDSTSVVFAPDEGRLDMQGTRLAGVTVTWKSGDQQGYDVCRDAYTEQGEERCTWSVGRDASADLQATTFRWLPRGARDEEGAAFYDTAGRRMTPESFALLPAKVTLTRLVPTDAAIDLATGQGEVPLVHPEAVGSAECGQLQCEMSNGRLIVRGATSLVNTVDLKLRLVPHVYMLRKEQLDATVSVKLSVLHCPMSIASGPPVRNNDDAKVIVKLEGRCAKDVNTLRFVTRDGPLKVLQTLNERDATYVLLQLRAVHGDTLTITAVRGEADGIALAVAYTPLRAAPQVRAALELPNNPNLGFIPNNRWANVRVSPAGEHQYFALLPVESIYDVKEVAGAPFMIRAEPHAAGLAVLRFGLRAERLPAGLDQVDLAVVEDPLQRRTAEANVPRSIDGSETKEPLVEFLCGGGNAPLHKIEVGVTAYLTYDLRDTCRVVFHRERLSKEDGTQKLSFEVDIIKPDNTLRGDAHVGETVTMRAGKEPRYAWIRGISDPFDRVRVRLSHVSDDDHYIGANELTGLPAAQWSAVLGSSRVRLYGTSAIPTGLYRFGFGADSREASGVLQLNFGVISRLALLDKEGKEFPVALETGVLVFGITNSRSQTGEQLFQVGVVAGLGFAVPISNRGQLSQASINVHAWVEINAMRDAEASRYAFIFGPSISIGNVGTSL